MLVIFVLLCAWARVSSPALSPAPSPAAAPCESSIGIAQWNVWECGLAVPLLGGARVVSGRRQRRAGRRDGHEPLNEEFLYRVPGAAEAAGVVRRLDVLPADRLVGLAVIARGYRDEPEEFYVFANTEDLSEPERALIIAVFSAFGTPTTLTIQHLAQGMPKPHLFATGDVGTIIPTLLAHDPAVPGSTL